MWVLVLLLLLLLLLPALLRKDTRLPITNTRPRAAKW
jgi:hypothetical protein